MFEREISIEYSPEFEPGHYEITPYSFKPSVARKLLANSYYDLGQGILDIIYEMYEKSKMNHKLNALIRQLMPQEDHK